VVRSQGRFGTTEGLFSRRAVETSIKVIPEQCVLWLEDCPAPLRRVWHEVVMTKREEPLLLRLK
jgi:hypothetical protein